MKNKTAFKRVNFQLPISLAHEFELAAQKEGTTKAKLLRKWIKETSEIKTLIRSKEKPVNFNLRIDLPTLATINNWPIAQQETMSMIMRSVIQSHISLHANNYATPGTENEALDQLWRKGEIGSIREILDPDPERLSLNQLSWLIRSKLDSGEISTIEPIINLYKDRALKSELPQALITKANLFKAETLLYKKEMISAENHLILARQALSYSNSRFIQYYFHNEMGHLYELTDTQELALESFLKAADFIDIQYYPIELAKTYASISVIYSGRRDFINAKHFITKAIEIVKNQGSKSHLGAFLAERGIIDYLEKNYAEAYTAMREGANLVASTDSLRRKYYIQDAMSTLPLIERDLDKAYKLTMRSEALEQEFRPSIQHSRTKYIKQFIQSKHNYSDAISNMDKMNTIQIRPNKKELGKYYLYAAQYLHGDKKERLIGEKNLTGLSREGKYALIKFASVNTLHSKQLQPIR
jgi:tetratricopeptide (TPR) repeat protein